MNTKIDWYKEVLELEPGSKVFFPLAKLLADDGRAAEAVAILRQGIDRHPDHLEAKLLCIELVLAQNGADSAVVRDVEHLADTISGYPGFWQTWANILEDQDERDCACAVQFLAAHFQGNDVTWAEVLERGLKAVLGAPGEFVPVRARQAARTPTAKTPRDATVSRVAAAVATTSIDDEAFEDDGDEDTGDSGVSFAFSDAPPPFREDDDALDAMALVGEAEGRDGDAVGYGVAHDRDADADEDMEEGDESISVRTKTMAVLLEDQGDYRGALEIYEELLASAESGPKRDDLARRIAMISGKLAGAGAPSQSGAASSELKAHDVADALKGKTKLMSTLEALASRLEARAAG